MHIAMLAKCICQIFTIRDSYLFSLAGTAGATEKGCLQKSMRKILQHTLILIVMAWLSNALASATVIGKLCSTPSHLQGIELDEGPQHKI